MKSRLTVLFAITFVVLGCRQSYEQEHDKSDVLPSGYEKAVKLVKEPEKQWWKNFNMPELDSLIDELNQKSDDLNMARQRVVKARALLGQRQAEDWPIIYGSADANKAKTEKANEIDSTSLGVTVAYEVDLWGQRSAAERIAELELVVQEQQFQSLSLMLQSQLSQSYFEVLALQERVETNKKNLEATKELYDLIKIRFDAGRSSVIELAQQRNILLEQRSRKIALEKDLVITKRALAVLLGRDQNLEVEIASKLDTAILPSVSAIQPASLLESRPDIKVAEANLKIRDAVVFQNKKKRWPTLNISAETIFSDLSQGKPVWSNTLIGGVIVPIFSAGRITNEIKAAEVDASIALINYRKTIVQAVRESMDVLSELKAQGELYELRKEELENNTRLFDLAKQSYEAGKIDFITFLQVQRSFFSSTERMIGAKQSYLNTTVVMFKVMGVAPQVAK